MSNPGPVAPDTVIESDWGNDVVSRVVPIYTDAAARTAANPAPAAGQMSFLTGGGTLEVYDGAAWVRVVYPGGGGIAHVDATTLKINADPQSNIVFANADESTTDGWLIRRHPSGFMGTYSYAAGGDMLRVWDDGAVHGPDGTIARPGFGFINASNAGMYLRSASSVGFVAAGVEFMFAGDSYWYLPAAITNVRFQGFGAFPTSASAVNLFVNTVDGKLYRSTSSRAAKAGISDFPASYAHDVIDGLRSVLYLSDNEGDNRDDYRGGFIAEEVTAAFPQATVDAPDNYDNRALVAALWAEVKSLRSRVAALEAAARP